MPPSVIGIPRYVSANHDTDQGLVGVHCLGCTHPKSVSFILDYPVTLRPVFQIMPLAHRAKGVSLSTATVGARPYRIGCLILKTYPDLELVLQLAGRPSHPDVAEYNPMAALPHAWLFLRM